MCLSGRSDAVDRGIRVVIEPLTLVDYVIGRIVAATKYECGNNLFFVQASVTVTRGNVVEKLLGAWITGSPLMRIARLYHKVTCNRENFVKPSYISFVGLSYG